MSSASDVQNLITQAEQLRDSDEYTDAMNVIANANRQAIMLRDRALIVRTMQVRAQIQEARDAYNRDRVTTDTNSSEDVNRCMEPDPPADLQCCSDVYDAEESEVLKRLAANDGTVVVEYAIGNGRSKYVCFNRSVISPHNLRSQAVRLCSAIAATTNSENMYGYANNTVTASRVKYVVKEGDAAGDALQLDVPEEDGSVSKLDVTIPAYTDVRHEPITDEDAIQRCVNRPSEIARWTAEVARLEGEWGSALEETPSDYSTMMVLEEELDNAKDKLDSLEREHCQQTKPGDIIYFKTHTRVGPAGSEELYMKLRFLGLDVGGVVDLKDFLYQIIGFPQVNRYVIEQRGPEKFVMLSNGLSVGQDVASSYHEFRDNVDEAIRSVVEAATLEPDDSDDLDAGVNWVSSKIDDVRELYDGDNETKKEASQAAMDIHRAYDDEKAVTDATSAAHCQVGQDTTVWLISPKEPVTITVEDKAAAMKRVMELYESAQYKPVTLRSLQEKVVKILKEAYEDRPSSLEGIEFEDPSKIDLDSLNNNTSGDMNEGDVYSILGERRGVDKLRCFIAQNAAHSGFTTDDNWMEIEDAMQRFHVEVPEDFGSGDSGSYDYITYEYDNIAESLTTSTADQICADNQVRYDEAVGDRQNPDAYSMVVRALGNFGDDEPSGEIEMDDDEFERGAQQVSNNLGFINEPGRFNSFDGNDGGPMRLSELNTSADIADDDTDILSEVGSLHSSDNDSIASLDLNDFDPPGSPQGRLTPAALNEATPERQTGPVTRSMARGLVLGTPEARNGTQSPPPIVRLRRRMRTEDFVDGDLTSTLDIDED